MIRSVVNHQAFKTDFSNETRKNFCLKIVCLSFTLFNTCKVLKIKQIIQSLLFNIRNFSPRQLVTRGKYIQQPKEELNFFLWRVSNSDIKQSWNTVFVLLDTLNQDIIQKNMSALFFCETKNRLPRHVNGSWRLESVLSAPSRGQGANPPSPPQFFCCCLKHGKTANHTAIRLFVTTRH